MCCSGFAVVVELAITLCVCRGRYNEAMRPGDEPLLRLRPQLQQLLGKERVFLYMYCALPLHSHHPCNSILHGRTSPTRLLPVALCSLSCCRWSSASLDPEFDNIRQVQRYAPYVYTSCPPLHSCCHDLLSPCLCALVPVLRLRLASADISTQSAQTSPTLFGISLKALTTGKARFRFETSLLRLLRCTHYVVSRFMV